jgi:hypothetical protein
METEAIIISVLMPILLGPLYVLLKELWDRYKSHNTEIKKNYYNERMNIVKNKLSLFYWPIYIKLCCLYHLNYNIIEDNERDDDNIEVENVDLSETQSDTPNEEELELRKRIKKKYKNVICGYRYKDDNQISIVCQNLVNHHDTYKYCYDCRVRMVEDGVPKRKLRRRKKNKEHITINISDDIEWERSTSESDNSTEEERMAILKLIDNNSDSSVSDITGDGLGVVKDLPKRMIQMDKILIDNLDETIIKLYLEIKDIILENIAIGQPRSKLGRELTKFIRFVEMEKVVYNSNREKQDKQFKSINLGVVNNIKKLLEIMEIDLFVLQREYNKMIKNYY